VSSLDKGGKSIVVIARNVDIGSSHTWVWLALQ
jgi:hypothetical protein